MIRIVSACAALAAASSAASAAFLGVDLRTNATWNSQASSALGSSHQVIRMYAAFDTPERVLNVGQLVEGAGFGLANPSSGFFQQVGGGNTAPNSGLFVPLPTLEWDTFVSIGVLDSAAVPVYGTSTDASFSFANMNVAPTQDFVFGGWFNSNPLNGQGETAFNAGTGRHEVFLGQFTVANLPGPFSSGGPGMNVLNNAFFGELTVFTQIEGGGAAQQSVTFTAIPAPGALAAFAAAGLVGTRRRRSA